MENKEIHGKAVPEQTTGAEAGGMVYGDISIGETTYGLNKFHARQGHGYAAERAEHLYDMLHGEDAAILGDDNVLNGADRIVNGVEIQSKYCQTGSLCISACFQDGQYRYYSQDGSPMQVEVPSDLYEDAVASMRRRIERQEVKGVTNPEDAVKLVKKGHFTYNQAKNIATAGTVESLTFDAVNGVILSTGAMGVSATISFALAVWNGEDMRDALEQAAFSGLKVGGVTFLTTVISSQLARTSLQATVRAGTDVLVKQMGPRVTAMLANALRGGRNIYGAAAMKNVSKLLSGNIIASTASLIVLSAGDIADAFRGRISAKQFFKDVATTGATIAGGSVGWGVGGTVGGVVGGTVAGVLTGGAGTAAGVKVGSAVGSFAGSVAGGAAAGSVTHSVLDQFVEDDAVAMLRIMETELEDLAAAYVLTEHEFYKVMDRLKVIITASVLKDMYASENRELFAQALLLQAIRPVIGLRSSIAMPSEDEILMGIRDVFEDAIDGIGMFSEEAFPSVTEVRDTLLAGRNVKEEQVAQILQPVIRMNKIQCRMEKELYSMKRDNEDAARAQERLMEERGVLKEELEQLLKGDT